MAKDLTQFERGAAFAGDYAATLHGLQTRLAALQLSQIAHGRRAMLLFEGWEAAGKRDVLKTLVGVLDPCHFAVHCAKAGDVSESDRHWLAHFWSALPGAGRTSIFYRSWHRRVVDQRAIGGSTEKVFARSCDEINEFESQQRDHGTLIVKLFFHVSEQVQTDRLRERAEDPWRRWLASSPTPSPDGEASRIAYLAAWSEALGQTDTRWAPWRLIDANDPQSARIAALEAVVQAFASAMPAEPPAEQSAVLLPMSRTGTR